MQGFTGSGKTSTLQYCLQKHDSKLYTFVSCKQFKGVKEVIAQLGNLKPLARQRAPKLLPKVIDNLKKDKKIIILDDVTAVPSWPELLNYMDGIYRKIQLPIFVTTNVFHFLDKLPEDVMHTLLFFRVDFPAYNEEELTAILQDRIKSSGAKFPYASLHLIGTLTAQVGSARDALAMCRTAIQTSKYELDEIRELYQTLEEQTYMDYLNKLAPKEREVLSYIVGKFIEKHVPIPVRDVSKELGLSPSRTSQLITALEQYEIITTQMNRKLGSFRVITPDDQLVAKVAKKEIILPA